MKSIILLTILFLFSCSPKTTKVNSLTDSSAKDSTAKISKKDSVVFIKQPEITEAISFFSSAYLYELKGNPTIAYSGYLLAHQYDSASLELMESLMRTAPSDSLRMTWASKILSNDSTNLNTIKYIADSYFDKDDKQNALKYYLMYTKADSVLSDDNGYIFYRLGNINYELGNTLLSVKYFNNLIKVSERFSFVRKNLVIMLSYDKEKDNTKLVDSLYTEWIRYDHLDKFAILAEYGMFLETAGNDRKALTMYNIALSNAPTKEDTLNVKKNISSTAYRLKMFDKMAQTTKDIIKEDSSFVIGINRLAVYYFDADSIDNSKYYFKKSLQQDSTQVLTLYFLGLIDSKEKKFSSAKNYFDKAIYLDSNYMPAYINLGYLELLSQNYKKADTLLLKVMDFDSNAYNSHYFYGLSRLYQKDYPKSVHHIGKALELIGPAKDVYDIQFDYASALEKNSMLDSSIVIFNIIIKDQPNFAPALNYLGYLLIQQDIDIEKGGEYIDRALVIEPQNGAYLDSKGWYYFKKGEYEKSLELLLQAYKILGEDLEILEHLGDVYTKLGQSQKGEEFYKKVLKIKGNKKWNI